MGKWEPEGNGVVFVVTLAATPDATLFGVAPLMEGRLTAMHERSKPDANIKIVNRIGPGMRLSFSLLDDVQP